MKKRSVPTSPHAASPRGRMTRAAFVILCAVVFAALAFGTFGALAAQQTGAPESAMKSDQSSPSGRPTFWLVYENGAWRVPLPNWSMEDVMRVIDSADEQFAPAPFSIQNIDATGEIQNGVARVSFNMTVAVADGLVRAPLGLKEGTWFPEEDGEDVPLNNFSWNGPGVCCLEVDSATGEYAVLFQTEPVEEPAREQAPEPEPASESENAPAETQDAPEDAENADAEEVQEPAEQPSEETQEPAGQAPEESPAQERDATAEHAPETALTVAVASESYAAQSDEDARRDGRSLRARPNVYHIAFELCFVIEGTVDGVAVSDPEAHDRAEYSFVASFPPSLHSQLTLTAPLSEVEIVSVKGAAADAPTSMSEDSAELRLRGLGKGGEKVEFVWRKARSQNAGDNSEANLALQVEDAVITVDLSARETAYEATLPIRVFGGETDVFRIQLPPGAELAPDPPTATGANGTAFEIESATTEDAPEDDPSGQRTLALRLSQRASSVTISVKARAHAAEAELGAEAHKSVRAIAGFSVVGARKQSGQVRIVKSQDSFFSIYPAYGAAVSDAVQDANEELYAFFSQPFLLTADRRERETIVNVRPEYQALVDYETQTLRARYQYSVYGSKVTELRVKLAGWTLASVSDSRGAVNQSALHEEEGEAVAPLNLPLDGELTVDFEFSRDSSFTDAEDGADAPAFSTGNGRKLVLPFPLPVATRVEPAAVVVVSDNAVRLTPIQDETVGLVRKASRSFTLGIEIPKDARQTPYCCQALSSGALAENGIETPVLVAEIERLRQEIEVRVRTEATVVDRGGLQSNCPFRVSQTFEYKVEREPVDSLSFLGLARGFENARAGQIKCFVDGKAHALRVTPVDEPFSDPSLGMEDAPGRELPARGSQYVSYRATLDPPRIGSFVATLQYDLAPVRFQTDASNYIEADLFQPELPMEIDPIITNELTMTVPSGVDLAYVEKKSGASRDDGDEPSPAAVWKPEQAVVSDDGRTESIRCKSILPEYFATFRCEAQRETGVVVVDRAWIQSWYSRGMRLDQIAYRLSCQRDSLELRLPSGTFTDRVSVSINGTPIPYGVDPKRCVSIENRLLRIPIQEDRQRAPFTLEIACASPSEQPAVGRYEAEFPVFPDGSAWIRRAYWQIILGNDRHVVFDPKGWTAEFLVRRGGWAGAYRRAPSVSQDELCDWVGAERRPALPQEANVYLYGAFGSGMSDDSFGSPMASASFYAANRAVLILVASGFALLLGLAILYLPVARGSLTLFVAGVVALALVALRPLISLLFLQTAALGAILALGAAALARFWERRERRASNQGIAAVAEARRRGAEQGAGAD